MKKKNLIPLICIGTLILIMSVNGWAQRPAGPQGGLNARAVLTRSGGTPADPEQEAAEEMNRILRSLRIVQNFFGIPEDLLRDIVEETYQEMLGLLRHKHEMVLELRELMNDPNPAPGLIGQLTIDIREVSAEIKVISQSWGDEIEALLDEEQQGRLARVRRLAGLIPAFKQVGLIPPPPPRVRPQAD